jgi:hypothetical protein
MSTVSEGEREVRAALEHIVAGAEFECERLTSGIDACYRTGRWTPDAEYWSDRCCNACIAFRGLIAASIGKDKP